MNKFFVDGQHLIRAGALLLGGVLVFVVVRALLVPAGFGELGHYRSGALGDVAALPLHFAGRAACEECHSDIAEARRGSHHERIGCESCHGALAAHAADPGSLTPKPPDAGTVCLRCHSTQAARPATFPQVDPKEHGSGTRCNECHKPHHPETS